MVLDLRLLAERVQPQVEQNVSTTDFVPQGPVSDLTVRATYDAGGSARFVSLSADKSQVRGIWLDTRPNRQ